MGDTRLEKHSEPSDLTKGGWWDVGRRVVSEVRDDKLQIVAAGLAFYALLAVFPALIAFVSIYGIVSDPADVQRLLSSAAESLPSDVASLIERQLSNIVESSVGSLSTTAILSIVGALWSASTGAHQLIKAIDLAYDTEESRGFFHLRGIAILVTLGFMVLSAVTLGLIVVVPPLLGQLALAGGLETAISVGRFVLLAAVLVGVLAVVYHYAPDRDAPQWEWASSGAIIATVLWIAASILFAIFVGNFGQFQETYGTLAGVIVLMLWFFISAFVVLLGAEINAAMKRESTDGSADSA